MLVGSETGYGEALDVIHMVRRFEDAARVRRIYRISYCRRNSVI